MDNKEFLQLWQIQQIAEMEPQYFTVSPKTMRQMIFEKMTSPQKNEQELLRENIQKEWNW